MTIIIMKKRVRNKKDMNMQISCNGKNNGACGGGIYFLGFLGSAVYYISTAATFGAGVLGFLKALVWPAFVVFELLRFLGM